ncbi:hypothetical protein TL16_g04079 [Triparma laevis f. inornata]|uniref:Uncharacterized protein n=1 Tax=Triparma laevis f. inornata TaxID=1714386 RepID=A0A9W7A6D1_9STRA|nr:hypothetical protein TL16_g04079 [Triparma laevis f. inornata]
MVAAWIINVVVMIRTWNVQRESKGGMYSGHDIEKQQLTAPLTGSSPYQAAPLGAQPKQPERPAQSSGFRDPIFLLLFVGTVVAMCGVAFTKGVDAVTDAASSSDTDGSTTISAGNKKAMGVIAILCACSVVLSGMILSFLMKNAESLIRTSLYINIFLTGLFAIVAFVNNQIWVALVCVLFTAINYCYMRGEERSGEELRGAKRRVLTNFAPRINERIF